MKQEQNQETFSTLDDYKQFLHRRKWHILLPLFICVGIAVAIAYLLPPVYRSSSTILIESQQVPQDLVRTTVTGFAEERIKAISAQILSRQVLLKIIKDFDLYPEERKKLATEEIIDKMRDDISVEMISAEVPDRRSGRAVTVNVAFTVSFEGTDPRKVMQVTNRLTSLFLEHNLKMREELAQTATSFLEDQAKVYRKRTQELEAKIAAFKQKHITELPELMGLNLQTERQLRQQIDDIDSQIRQAKNRLVYLQGQLATVSPDITVQGPTGQIITDPVQKLKMLRSQEISMEANLSPRHPDLIKLRQEIANLEKEVGNTQNRQELIDLLKLKEEDLKKKSADLKDKHPDIVKLKQEISELKKKIASLPASASSSSTYVGKPDNPAYINLQTQIKAAKIELAGLEARKKDLTQKWEEYIKRLEKMPEVEREYRELNRDYETAQAEYKQITAKLMEAKQGQTLEQRQASEKFTVIDPPQLPEKPVKPNRIAIILIGLVLGIGIGIGIASIVEMADTTIRTPADIKRITGRSPLVSILNADEVKGKK